MKKKIKQHQSNSLLSILQNSASDGLHRKSGTEDIAILFELRGKNGQKHRFIFFNQFMEESSTHSETCSSIHSETYLYIWDHTQLKDVKISLPVLFLLSF